MKRLVLAITIALTSGVLAAPAFAAHASALMAVAANLGYAYAYLGPEDAIALSRPGVTVVVRPGELLYDVNDRTEAMDGQAPYFNKSDVFVSDAFVKRLRQLAVRYPLQAVISADDRASRLTNLAGGAGPITGAVSGLNVVQTPGASMIAIDGTAPPNFPVTLTLVATLSKDIPDVVLSRHRINSDSHGRFSTNVSVAPGNFTGTIYTLVASSLPGIAPASAQLTLKAPNAKQSLPADKLP